MTTNPFARPFARRTLTALATLPLAATLVACGDSDDDDDAAPAAPTTTVTATPTDDAAGGNGNGGGNGGGGNGDDGPGRVGPSGGLLAAGQTALDEVGGATITSIDDDPAGWEISLVGGSGGEQEIVVSADGSRVVAGPRPDDDLDADDVREEQALVQSAQIDYAAAVDAASARVSGDVVSVDLDGDDGLTTWTVTIRDGAGENEVAVDARSGDVLGTEQDD